MLKKRIEYKDFLGQPRAKDLYFNLSESDVQRMMLKEAYFVADADGNVDPDQVRNGMVARIEGVMERGIGKEIVELFDWLVTHAYGEILDDGETFDNNNPERYAAWTKTASYDVFFTTLVNDTDMMTEFFNGIFPKNFLGKKTENKQDPEFSRHREELAARAARENPTV